MEYSKLIKNFIILNKMNPNDKLWITGDVLSIHSSKQKCRSLCRYFYNQNRERIYAFLINLINFMVIELDKFNYYQFGMSCYKLEELNIQNDAQYASAYWKLIDFKLSSIDNLKITYKEDKYFTRKLDLLKSLIEELDPNIKKYSFNCV